MRAALGWSGQETEPEYGQTIARPQKVSGRQLSQEMCLYSIAFQLKRIADALEDPPADPHLQKIAELLENLGTKL